MWVSYFKSVMDDQWKCICCGLQLLSYYQPNDCSMMIPGSYAQMHEDYDG